MTETQTATKRSYTKKNSAPLPSGLFTYGQPAIQRPTASTGYSLVSFPGHLYACVITRLDKDDNVIDQSHSEVLPLVPAFAKLKDAIWLKLLDFQERKGLFYRNEILPHTYDAFLIDNSFNLYDATIKDFKVSSKNQIAVEKNNTRYIIAHKMNDLFRDVYYGKKLEQI